MNIGDINDNAPECPTTPTVYVLSDTPPQTVVGSFLVSDKDAGINAKISYTLETNYFDISDEGELLVIQ